MSLSERRIAPIVPALFLLGLALSLLAAGDRAHPSPQLAAASGKDAPRKKDSSKPATDTPIAAVAPFDAEAATRHQDTWASHLGVPVEYTNSIGMTFRLIPPGEFTMGCPPDDVKEELAIPKIASKAHWQDYVRSSAPQHTTILTKAWYLAKHEVTQEEYMAVLKRNPSYFSKSGTEKEYVDLIANTNTSRHPVEGVTWNDAVDFCIALSKAEKLSPPYSRADKTTKILTGTGYRLPTEAEWEFACRAGTTTRYWSGDTNADLSEVGWWIGNSGQQTHPVGQLPPNPFGLCDMHGNVWEFVQDAWEKLYYSRFTDKSAINPTGPTPKEPMRVLRGGHCFDQFFLCRSAFRYPTSPHTSRQPYLGFRVALPVEAVRKGAKK